MVNVQNKKQKPYKWVKYDLIQIAQPSQNLMVLCKEPGGMAEDLEGMVWPPWAAKQIF